MTAPDPAVDPLMAEEEAEWRRMTVSESWKRVWATLDAARAEAASSGGGLREVGKRDALIDFLLGGTTPADTLRRVNETRAALATPSDPAARDGLDVELRAALARNDRTVAAYHTAEEAAAARKDWPQADRWRYLATGVEEANNMIRAALHSEETAP